MNNKNNGANMLKSIYGTYPQLEKILKSHHDKKKEFPDYPSYSEQVKSEFRQQDIEGLRTETLQELTNHFTKLETNLKSENLEALKITYPNNNNTSAIEINNALLEYSLKSGNVEDNITKGFELGRPEYAFKLLGLYQNDNHTKASQNFVSEIYNKVGLTEKLNSIENLRAELDETQNQLDLINYTPDQFDKNIERTISVVKRMKESSQLTNETVFAS